MVTCEPEWEPALARMSMTGTDDDDAGTNCIKIGLPGKLILSKRNGLREDLFS